MGAVLASIAFALIPLCARSAMDVAIRRDETTAVSSSGGVLADAHLALPRLNDPFARSLPPSTFRQMQPGRNAPKGKPHGHPFVRAIVAGVHPRALVEDGSVRIVGIGDPVDGSNVVDIEPNGVVLGDRRRLGFGDTTR